MKKIVALMVVIIFLIGACKESQTVNTVVELDSLQNVKKRLVREHFRDSMKLVVDSLGELVLKTGQKIDSLIRIRKVLKNKKLDSLIEVEKENYKSYLMKREESTITYEGF